MDICVLWNMWRLGGKRRHGSADWRGLGSAVLRGIRGSPPTTSVYLQDGTTRVLASFRERAIARLLDIAIVFVPVAAPVVLSTLLGGGLVRLVGWCRGWLVRDGPRRCCWGSWDGGAVLLLRCLGRRPVRALRTNRKGYA